MQIPFYMLIFFTSLYFFISTIISYDMICIDSIQKLHFHLDMLGLHTELKKSWRGEDVDSKNGSPYVFENILTLPPHIKRIWVFGRYHQRIFWFLLDVYRQAKNRFAMEFRNSIFSIIFLFVNFFLKNSTKSIYPYIHKKASS